MNAWSGAPSLYAVCRDISILSHGDIHLSAPYALDDTGRAEDPPRIWRGPNWSGTGQRGPCESGTQERRSQA